MLSLIERIVFVLLVIVCGGVAFSGFRRIFQVVRMGERTEQMENLFGRVLTTVIDVGLQRPVFRARPMVSVFHAFIFFGFSFYILVNINDLLEAFYQGWTTIGGGLAAGIFNLLADILSVLVLIGMVFFLIRRFVFKPPVLEYNPNVKLHLGVTAGGIQRDSLIVGIFILLHVGSRWTGTAFHLVAAGHNDPWLPTPVSWPASLRI